MKKYIFTLTVLLLAGHLWAQTVPQLSQRNFDVLFFNPAIAGSKLSHELQLHHRSQWVGFNGGPTTPIFSYNGALSNKVGLGAYFYNDNTQTTTTFGGGLSYAYHLTFSKFNLSMGVSGSLSRYSIDLDKVEFQDTSDPYINAARYESELVPDASAGVYAYNKKFYVGLSISEMFKSLSPESFEKNLFTYQNYYLIGGYTFEFGKFFQLTPNTIVTYGNGKTIQADLGFRGTLYDRFMAGVNYRHNDAVILSTGIRFMDNLFFAYSYDIGASDLHRYNNGSHEVILSFVISRRPGMTDGVFQKRRIGRNKRSYW